MRSFTVSALPSILSFIGFFAISSKGDHCSVLSFLACPSCEFYELHVDFFSIKFDYTITSKRQARGLQDFTCKMPVRLPPELCDQIIDNAWDDRETLKACCLTCKDWVPSSRYHLFRIVRLHSAKDCTEFHNLISASPSIAYYVREFTISAEYCGYDSQGRAVEDDGWVDGVAGVVNKLSRVSTLALSRLRWGKLSLEAREALLKLGRGVKTLLLFEVTFTDARDMLEFLSAFFVLTELYLHAVNWGEDTRSFQGSRSQGIIRIPNSEGKMQLTYLFLDTTSSPTIVTEWILNHPTENCLRTIQLCWRDFENTRLLGDLLSASGTSLEELHIDFPMSVPEEGEFCSSPI